MIQVPPLAVPDPKAQAILAAAFDAFRHYGFRRTTMEDIARGAGMSRAALYLHYANKEAIFRALIRAYFETAQAGVRQALSRELPIAEALAQAFAAQAGEMFEALLSSPHGAELLDAKTTAAADLVAEGDARIVELYAGWLAREVAAGRLRPEGIGEPLPLAETMMAALYGLKATSGDWQDYAASARRLADLFARGLSA